MAQVTIYKPATVECVVIDGTPPVDQTALVASLQSQRDALAAQVLDLNAQVLALSNKIAAAQAALA